MNELPFVSEYTVGDHLRVTTAAYPDGRYRVVGTSAERLTLLRVTDETDRRAHTGAIVHVEREELDNFETAEPPADDGGAFDGIYWSLRTFVGQLVAHPLVSLAGLVLVLVGWVGDGFLPDPLDTVALLVGALALAVVGSGRL